MWITTRTILGRWLWCNIVGPGSGTKQYFTRLHGGFPPARIFTSHLPEQRKIIETTSPQIRQAVTHLAPHKNSPNQDLIFLCNLFLKTCSAKVPHSLFIHRSPVKICLLVLISGAPGSSTEPIRTALPFLFLYYTLATQATKPWRRFSKQHRIQLDRGREAASRACAKAQPMHIGHLAYNVPVSDQSGLIPMYPSSDLPPTLNSNSRAHRAACLSPKTEYGPGIWILNMFFLDPSGFRKIQSKFGRNDKSKIWNSNQILTGKQISGESRQNRGTKQG